MQKASSGSNDLPISGIAVALLTEDRERLAALQSRLASIHMARLVFSQVGFPLAATDPIIRQIQNQAAEVVMVDLDPANLRRGIHAIELLRATTNIAIFALGVHDKTHILAAMQAGACDYVERAAVADELLEAFNRFVVSRSRARSANGKARVFTVINAKGGSGATALAVNLAIALQQNHGQTVLVDLAPGGHAALHLNVRASRGVLDALQSLHRLDATLLEGLVTTTKIGLHLLAGSPQPCALAVTAAELAGLFDLLVSLYQYVLVDCSSRIDNATRLLAERSTMALMVAHADVVSLWSARNIHTFLEEGVKNNRLRLVLNRYKKIHGFGEGDFENATGCPVLWKLPNNYELMSTSIDNGVPVVSRGNQELSRSLRSLAELLAATDGPYGSGGPDGAPPAVPVLSPQSGGPPLLPPRRLAWES
jgi:Flp pilus assembly CpaE family ATPase